MLRKILLVVLVVVVGAVVVGLARGSHWRIEQRAQIAARPDVIAPLLTDFEKGWPQWSVWHGMDPEGKWSYGGTASTPAHSMAWDGPTVGHGKLTLAEVGPMSLRYDGAIEGDEVNNHGSLTWLPAGAQTEVVWIDEGDAPPVIGGLFMGMLEDMLNDNFTRNLAALKVVAEKQQAIVEANERAAAALTEAKAEEAATATPGARASMSIGTPVILGSLGPELLLPVVEEHADQLAYCFERALAAAPGLRGKVTMKWVVNGEGKVTMAHVAETELKNANVEQCLTAKIRTWVFPRPKGGGIVIANCPFTFAPPTP